MKTNYTFNNGGTTTDFGDVFIPRDIFSQGGLFTFGYNVFGQLGDNTDVNKSSPVQTIAGGTNWKSVSCNEYYTTAIKTDGTLWTWGYNLNGRLGDGTTVSKISPVQTIAAGTNWRQISAGTYHAAAIKTDGALWLWGLNANGQLGDNTAVDKSSPVQTIAGGTNWKQVSCGYSSTAAIKTDGTLWTWGYNIYGQLGDNTTVSKSSPVQTIAGGTNWKQVAVGGNHNAAIKTDGTLWTWGLDTSGQLGDTTSSNKSSPVQTIAGGTNWKYVSAGNSHTAAIKADGTLWLWGSGTLGKLGTGSITQWNSPVQTISGGTNWKQVAAGENHSAAIKTDGTLWTWGYNFYGQLGGVTTNYIASPTQVGNDNNWKQASCGNYHTAATRDDLA